MKHKKILLLSSTLGLLLLFFLGIKLYKINQLKKIGFMAKENYGTFVRDHSPTKGSDEAKVHVVEFLDPECESCRIFHPDVKKLLAEYEGKIRLVVRYAAFHGNSRFVIKVLEAARKQDKYWEALELLFKYQPLWGDHHNPRPELVWTYLPEIDVDVERIKKDMKENDLETDKIIAQDLSDGAELGVRGTPTFFVNGKPLPMFGLQYLEEAIKAELAK